MLETIYSVMVFETLLTMGVIQIHSHDDNILNCTTDCQQLHTQGLIYWGEFLHFPSKAFGLLGSRRPRHLTSSGIIKKYGSTS